MVVVLLDLIELDQLRVHPFLRQSLMAFSLSCLGVLVMLVSYRITPGVQVDSRVMLLFVVGLYFGLLPTLSVVVITGLCRWYIGGAGVLPGIFSILISATAGRIMYHFYSDRLSQVSLKHLLLVSFALNLVMGGIIYISAVANGVERHATLFFLLYSVPAFTLGTAFLALFISHRIRSRERRQKLLDLDSQQRLLSSAIEQSPSVVVITDTEGIIEYVNPKFTELTGYGSEEAIGLHTRELNSGMLPKSLFTELWEDISSGKVWRGEFLNKRKDGSLFWESASIAPFFGANGEIEKYIAVKENITKRKELEAQISEEHRKLNEANEVKSKFISMMSHELMTPLNHILAPTEMVLDVIEDSDCIELLKLVQSGGMRLKRIFHDMISISDKSFAKEEFKEEAVIVSQFLEWFRHRSFLHDQGVLEQLEIRVDDALEGEFRIRTELVSSVLDQFLDNAFKFAGNGTVELSAEREADGILFCVRDRGPGVPEEFQQQFGQPFEAFDMSSTRNSDGLGLGLAVCRVMADICGGRVEVVNRPHGGSEFSFYYPIDSESL
jgi:PAS domain S-box-containing protein